MFKKFLAFFAAMYMAVSFAAVDVNKATAAELDGIKGIGPGISTKIVDERKKGTFKDWNDFISRVKGVGEGNAAKFSAQGLTVGGAAYKGVAASAKKDDKPAAAAAKPATPAAKADDKKVDAKPATPAVAAAPAAAMAKDEKKDAKATAKDEKKDAKMDAKKDAKKDDKKDVKADAAKPAASAAKK